MIQSQEGALNVVPRPRFKINDGNDQAESIHLSHSEIQHQTGSPDQPADLTLALSTLNVMNGNNKVELKATENGRNGQQSSSQLD